MSSKQGTQKSSKKTTGKASTGFTAEERAAMKERAQELEGGRAHEQEPGGRGKSPVRENRRNGRSGSRHGREAP